LLGRMRAFPRNWILLQANTNVGALASRHPIDDRWRGVERSRLCRDPELSLIPDRQRSGASTPSSRRRSRTTHDADLPETAGSRARGRSSSTGAAMRKWGLRRSLRHARELVYIERRCSHNRRRRWRTADRSRLDIFTVLAARLNEEPRLRVVILRRASHPSCMVRTLSMYFYGNAHERRANAAASCGNLPAPGVNAPRVVAAHRWALQVVRSSYARRRL